MDEGMYVEWDPENGEDKQSWQFDSDSVLRKDVQLIEKHFGGSWDQWIQGLRLGQMSARVVLLWYMIKLVHPTYRFDAVPDFRVRQLKVEMGSAELKELYERAKKLRLDDDTREAFEAQFETDMRDALRREGVEADVNVEDGQLTIESGLQELPKAP